MKLLIFTYAPAGLGHLRVTDALIGSRPNKYPYIMLGSYDKFVTGFHRFVSTNPVAKFIFTVSQYGFLEDLVTMIYRWALFITRNQAYNQLKLIFAGHKTVDEVWIISTHFGMAHQIGAIKERLAKETGKKVRLIVQVTDDTSQHIWCVRGADLTFVPSYQTRNELERYSKMRKMNLLFEVVPYPLSQILINKLDSESIRDKAFLSKDEIINVAVPISGAAVGLSYLIKLISLIEGKSSRFRFWVLVKKSIYTDLFLSTLSKLSNVTIITGRNDNEMVSLYGQLYQNNLMHIEITKPSEQAFKAILPPSFVGGSIVLFTSPVGRQEFENIDFLVRHGLMSGPNNGGGTDRHTLMPGCPRAIRLSENPEIAASFIVWALESGLFSKMSSFEYKFSKEVLDSMELGPGGAEEFWKITEKYFG